MLAAQAVDMLPCSHLADTNDAISFDPNVLSLRSQVQRSWSLSLWFLSRQPMEMILCIQFHFIESSGKCKKTVSNVHLRSARSLRCCQVAAFLVSGIRVQACFQAVIPCHVRSCSKLRGQNPTNLWQLVYFPKKYIIHYILYITFIYFIFYIIYIILYYIYYILYYIYNVKYYI